MRKIIFSLIILSCSRYVIAQQPVGLTRVPYTLKLPVSNGTFYEEKVGSTAYVLPNKTIQLYPGEKIFVEVELDKGMIKNLTTVKKNLNPSKTIEISFTQESKNGNHERVMLQVQNPFDQKLSYKARIFVLNGDKWRSVSMDPVRAKMGAFEIWPDLITSFALYDWKLEN